MTSSADAQLLRLLGKSAKSTAAATGTAGRVAAKALTKAEVAALAGGLTGAIYIEAKGGKVLLEALESASGAVSGSADDVFKLSKQMGSELKIPARKYILNHHTLDELNERLHPLIQQGNVYIADPVAGPIKLVAHHTRDGWSAFKQLRPGILTPTRSHLTTEIIDVLNIPAQSEKIAVLSMFAETDIDSIKALASAAGERLLGTEMRDRMLRSQVFDDVRGKFVVVVGHVEDGKFMAKGANGAATQAIAIDQLEKMAEAADVTLVSAGCSSFCFGSKAGYARPITDRAAADSIKEALDAVTLGDMLGAFGKANPLILSEESLHRFSSTRRLELAHDARFDRPVSATTLGIRVFSPLHKAIIDRETRQALLFWYGVGLIGMLSMFSANRDAFKRAYPVLPAPSIPSAQLMFALRALLREMLFIALAPAFMAVVIITWFFGAWRYRRQLLVYFWSFVRTPFSALALLVLWLLSVALIMGAYFVVILALLGLAMAIAIPTFDGSWQQPAFGFLVALNVAYWLLATVVAYKLHRKFTAWAGNDDQHKPPAAADVAV